MIILIGNKIDLVEDGVKKKEVENYEAIEKCEESGFFWGGELSAKTFSKEDLTLQMNKYIVEMFRKVGIKKVGKQISRKVESRKKKSKFC